MTKFTANLLYADGNAGPDLDVNALNAADAAKTVKQVCTSTGVTGEPKSIVLTTVEPRSVTNVDYDTLQITFEG